MNLLERSKHTLLEYGRVTRNGRAFPSVLDGLLPVQRRLLYVMRDMKLTPNNAPRKSASVVGNTLASFHPHGDNSVYTSLCNMAETNEENKKLRFARSPNPLVAFQGNLGSFDDAPAAMRYTEVKLSKNAMDVFFDSPLISMTEMVDNYDGTTQEPVWLPSTVPYVLACGTFSSAVGTSGSLPPFSLESIKPATQYFLDWYFDPNQSESEADLANALYSILKLAHAKGGRASHYDKSIIDGHKGRVTWHCEYTRDKSKVMVHSLSPASGHTTSALLGISHESLTAKETTSKYVGYELTFTAKGSSTKDKDAVLDWLIANKLVASKTYSPKVVVTIDGAEKLLPTSVIDIMHYWLDGQLSLVDKCKQRVLDESFEALSKAVLKQRVAEKKTNFAKNIPDLNAATQSLKLNELRDKMHSHLDEIASSIPPEWINALKQIDLLTAWQKQFLDLRVDDVRTADVDKSTEAVHKALATLTHQAKQTQLDVLRGHL